MVFRNRKSIKIIESFLITFESPNLCLDLPPLQDGGEPLGATLTQTKKKGGFIMAIIEVGRICIKTHGRENGKKCIIADVIDRNFVLITGPKEITGIRRRRTNVKHIEPTSVVIKIKKGVEDKQIIEELKKAEQLDFLKEEIKK